MLFAAGFFFVPRACRLSDQTLPAIDAVNRPISTPMIHWQGSGALQPFPANGGVHAMKSETAAFTRTLTPSEELRHFKALVRSLMDQAGSILADIELAARGKGVEEKIAMLDHCIDYTRRLC